MKKQKKQRKTKKELQRLVKLWLEKGHEQAYIVRMLNSLAPV